MQFEISLLLSQKRCQVSVPNITARMVLHCSPAAYNNFNTISFYLRNVDKSPLRTSQHAGSYIAVLRLITTLTQSPSTQKRCQVTIANITAGRVLHCSPVAYTKLNTICFYLRNVVRSPQRTFQQVGSYIAVLWLIPN
ncbi:hypothetical protein J6590_093331 [Homalodisca vitripennis]|nr:hypothetical protein J6590_093331 [Homalodisca vitripennis]